MPRPPRRTAGLTTLDTLSRHTLNPARGGTGLITPSVPAPVGYATSGAEISLFTLPGPGLALTGAGAEPAARAILAATLTTGADTTTVEDRPVVVTTAALLTRLLPPGAAPVGLDPDGTTFDGERLIVLADTTAVLTHAEEEVITRQRLLDTFDTTTIAGLNTRTDHAETQPPYVLLIDATTRHAGQLQAIAAYRATLDLHPVIVGPADGFPTRQIRADGTVTDDEAIRRLAVLTASDLASVLAMLTEAAPRPEPGHDIDDPTPQEPAPARGAFTEPAEAVPAQQRQTPALARLSVLGPVTVTTAAGPVTTGMRSGSYTALALLAAHPRGRTMNQLTDAIYPTVEETLAVKRVRTAITAARRTLREATGTPKAMFILHDQASGLYRLDPDTITVDLWQMLTTINAAANASDDAEVLAALREAADLYGGDFATGYDHPWAVDYATTYRHQILTAYGRIAEIVEADQPDHAITALEHAITLDPVNEELYQRIMRIHGRHHRPDAVRRTLRRLEERLADLDTEPSAATRRVAERQLRPEPVSGGRP